MLLHMRCAQPVSVTSTLSRMGWPATSMADQACGLFVSALSHIKWAAASVPAQACVLACFAYVTSQHSARLPGLYTWSVPSHMVGLWCLMLLCLLALGA